jgi:hypothetical protein
MLTFELASDTMFFGNHWEDGEPIFGMVFYVLAQMADGTRYRHFHNYTSKVKTFDNQELVWFWADRYEEAKEAAERFFERVKAKGTINRENWVETYPVYGSDAYIQQEAEGVHLEWERRTEANSQHHLQWVA